MPYAEVADVRSRAGVLAPSYNQGAVVDADLERFLDDAAGLIDAALAARGLTVPIVEPQSAVDALRSLNADGALLVAIPARFPDADDQVAALLRETRKRWDDVMDPSAGSIAKGTYTVVEMLVAREARLGPSDFWTENPDYGLPGTEFVDPDYTNPWLAPRHARTDRF